MVSAKGGSEFVKRYYRGIATAVFKPTDVLLTEARDFCKLFLRQAIFLPHPPNVLSD
jgi:hypothetical protein